MKKIFSLIFAFKRLFSNEKADIIIAEYFYHPVIWEFLSDEKRFLQIEKMLN